MESLLVRAAYAIGRVARGRVALFPLQLSVLCLAVLRFSAASLFASTPARAVCAIPWPAV